MTPKPESWTLSSVTNLISVTLGKLLNLSMTQVPSEEDGIGLA